MLQNFTYSSKVVYYEGCLKWCHIEGGTFLDADYLSIAKTVWFSIRCLARKEIEANPKMLSDSSDMLMVT